MGMGIDSTIHTTPGAKCARAPEALEREAAIEVEEGLPASRTACLQDFLFNVPASFKYSALVLLHRKKTLNLLLRCQYLYVYPSKAS
jgi:hypothetical protein